ncbi:uncharacterized protein K441DRAFT_151300 [Cenococcum geophilum 1.58]|uniref:uncharacterized protein n=1 Tax=Cenococcum geophilum 1.58 TaxID=794803 RepID=UPI00358EAA35|nr:hypothetical protein K441DRAFT_151300 [Cenococcum geophilum 1.58]
MDSDATNQLSSSQPASTFEYRLLEAAKHEIRVLTLLPPPDEPLSSPTNADMPEDTVCCTLEYVSLDAFTPAYEEYWRGMTGQSSNEIHFEWHFKFDENDNEHDPERLRFVWGDYSALSYVWGSPDDTRTILLNEKEVTIRANLEAALRSLRCEPEFRNGLKLWADAICIDQANINERNHEVQHMGRIYGRADTVTVWLGSEVKCIRSAIQALRECGNTLHDMDNLTPTGILQLSTALSPALIHISNRPYWERLWIIQEIAIGTPCMALFLGRVRVPWDYAALLAAFYEMAGNQLDCIRPDTYPDLSGQILKASHRLSRLMLYVDARRGPVSAASNYFGTLSRLLDMGSLTTVSDDRDHVYGLLALLPPSVSTRITPDYSLSVGLTFCDLARAIIEDAGTFNLLFSHSSIKGSIPSWCPDFRVESNFLLYSSYWETCETSGDIKIDYKFSEDKTILVCKGWRMDTVDSCGRAPQNAEDDVTSKVSDRLAVQPRRGKHGYALDTSIKTRLLRAILMSTRYEPPEGATLFDVPWLCDVELDSELFQKFGWPKFTQSQLMCDISTLQRANAGYQIWGLEFRALFSSEIKPYNPDEFHELWNDLMEYPGIGRTLFTTSGGFLGSTRCDLKQGDLIYAIAGCKFPVLLRLKGDYFQMVGECYVEGLMLGESLEWLESGECNMENVSIC